MVNMNQPTKKFSHEKNMANRGFCPACDLRRGECDKPVRTRGFEVFGLVTYGDMEKLVWLDRTEGPPEWFPVESERRF